MYVFHHSSARGGENDLKKVPNTIRGVAKISIPRFLFLSKNIHFSCGILHVRKHDFRNFTIFAQNVTFYALKGSSVWIFSKKSLFGTQNDQ